MGYCFNCTDKEVPFFISCEEPPSDQTKAYMEIRRCKIAWIHGGTRVPVLVWSYKYGEKAEAAPVTNGYNLWMVAPKFGITVTDETCKPDGADKLLQWSCYVLQYDKVDIRGGGTEFVPKFIRGYLETNEFNIALDKPNYPLVTHGALTQSLFSPRELDTELIVVAEKATRDVISLIFYWWRFASFYDLKAKGRNANCLPKNGHAYHGEVSLIVSIATTDKEWNDMCLPMLLAVAQLQGFMLSFTHTYGSMWDGVMNVTQTLIEKQSKTTVKLKECERQLEKISYWVGATLKMSNLTQECHGDWDFVSDKERYAACKEINNLNSNNWAHAQTGMIAIGICSSNWLL